VTSTDAAARQADRTSRYVLICNLEGSYRMGMYTDLTVS
jgi:uncharacterized cupredoxin-like copper-binding protein